MEFDRTSKVWSPKSGERKEPSVERLRAILVGTAQRHGLRYEWENGPPVDVALNLLRQPGMDFAVSFWLADDTFGCGAADWYASILLTDDEAKWNLIARIVEGIITGDARIALYAAPWRKRPYWTEVQLRDEGRWQSVSTGIGCAFPPFYRKTVLRNGREREIGSLFPAYGSIAVFLMIAAAFALLFR